jgi:hypothetical protein
LVRFAGLAGLVFVDLEGPVERAVVLDRVDVFRVVFPDVFFPTRFAPAVFLPGATFLRVAMR